jgi:stage II sporulation protein P
MTGKRVKARTGLSVRILIRRLCAVAALCLILRVSLDLIEKEKLAAAPEDFTERIETAMLKATLPGAWIDEQDIALTALTLTLPGNVSEEEDTSDTEQDTVPPVYTTQEIATEPELPTSSQSSTETDTPADDAVETTITGDSGEYDMGSSGIYIKNKTDYEIDVDGLLSSPLGFSAADGAEVLIIHTHGSEAYTPDDEDIYEASDPSRTVDKSYNVIRVGDELERVLTERGITVIHDRELYDYPSYNGSYSRAYDAICGYLADNPNIKVVIDLHRDALVSDSGTVYKTVADIGDSPCAQVMLIAGTDFSGLQHDKWQENLSFALKIQAQMVREYPTLARPLSISQYRYNQNATTGSLIAEVGCSGNTLKEALNAVGYFGECLADVLLGE